MTLGEIALEASGPRAARLRLIGEFDLSNVREVEALAYEQIGAGVRDLCFDLQAVTFIDSSMLNLLVNLHKRLATRGGTLTLDPNLEIEKLLEMTGLLALFQLAGPGH